MPKTPLRLFGPALLTNAAATKYTVPAGKKTIVRYIHLENGSVNSVAYTISIGADAAGTRISDAVSLGPNTEKDIYCYHVLEAAEIVQAFAGTTNVITMTLNGDEYTLG